MIYVEVGEGLNGCGSADCVPFTVHTQTLPHCPNPLFLPPPPTYREWNTHSRHCHAAQAMLAALLRRHRPGVLAEVQGECKGVWVGGRGSWGDNNAGK